MEFLIEQFDNNFRLTKKGDSRIILSGNWSSLFGKFKAEIYRNENLIYSIVRKWNTWKWNMSYLIENDYRQSFKLTSKNKWHSLYEMAFDENIYELKIHKGRKKSVFKNGKQIANIDESLVEIFYHDKIRIITNDQESINEIFLIVVCLKIGEENSGGLTFDLGNLGKTEPIDEQWKP
jgi:hypothetical protein